MNFFKNAGRGRPDFHELHLLYQLFLEFQEISWPSTKLPNTLGALCKLMTCWVRSPANEFVCATGICNHQPQWIQGKNDGEEENITPDCY